MARQASPSDVSDEGWTLVAPSVPRMTAHVLPACAPLARGLQWPALDRPSGAAWRMIPHGLPLAQSRAL
jgi:transposase